MKAYQKILLFVLLFPFTGILAQSKIPDYSLTDRENVPEELKWNLNDIYSSLTDWEKDKNAVLLKIDKIEKDSKLWTSDASKMFNMLLLVDEISEALEKLSTYAVRSRDVDMGNQQYQKMAGEIQSIYVSFGTKISFMNNDILSLGKNKFEKFLTEKKELQRYKFYVEKVLRGKDHILPPEQQNIVSRTGLYSGGIAQAAGTLNDLEMPAPEVTLSDGKKVVLTYPNYMLYRGSKNADDRSLVMHTFWNNHKKFENTLAILQNSEIKEHYFNALTYKFPGCLEARLFDNNIDTSVYYQLIRSVHKNLDPLHKYLTLKKQLLGLDKYRYDDIYASAVNAVDKTYTLDEAKQIIMESLKPLGKDYVEGIKRALNERWIDFYPNKGKESGAYSGGLYSVHPYIKLNYIGDYDAVSTLTHELGHSMHSFFSSKNQTYNNSHYPIFLAEVASTFNENLMMSYLIKNETDDLLKLYLLDSYIDGARATIYRQTLFAEFELEMHKKVEKGESLTSDWLNKTYLDLTREYYGHDKGVTEVGEYIQNEWSSVPHFYYNYYVYQYSTGLLASMALSSKVLNGSQKDLDDYLTFLKSGGSNYPLEILKKAGIDMSKPEPIDAGMKYFSSLVDEMEVLVNKLKKENKI